MAYEDEDTIESLQEVFKKMDAIANKVDDVARHLEAVLPPHQRRGIERLIEGIHSQLDALGEEVDSILAELEEEEE